MSVEATLCGAVPVALWRHDIGVDSVENVRLGRSSFSSVTGFLPSFFLYLFTPPPPQKAFPGSLFNEMNVAVF